MPIYKLRIVSDKLCESASVKATNPKETVRYLLDHCFPPEEAWRERVVAVFTNRALEVTGHIEVATGGTASTCIDIKVIAKAALDTLAEGVILAHNHPSGPCTPSNADIEITRKIKSGLSTLQIKLIDHIILGNKEYFSFNEERTIAMPETKQDSQRHPRTLLNHE